MPRIPTMSRAALLKMQAKTPADNPARAASKMDTSKKKTKKKPTSKR